MRRMFGWSLPPGCTLRDIEEQACGAEDDDGEWAAESAEAGMLASEPDPLDDGIPDFLRISPERRAEAWREWDARHAPVIAQEDKIDPVAEMKRERKRVAIEKLHVRLDRARARKSGELKKMPLEGRAALRAIKDVK